MRNAIVALLALAAGLVTAGVLVSKHLADRQATELAAREQAWATERAKLEDALNQARADALTARQAVETAPVVVAAEPTQLLPSEIIAKLIDLSSDPKARTRVGQREIVYWLEELTMRGTAALPTIQEFLQRYEDLELDTSVIGGRSARNRLPGDFLFPPSLRFGLFDVVQRIGGRKAESILAEALNQTGRGIEVAYLTRALQEMAPDKYRRSAIAAASRLLMQPDPQSTSPLDRNHRDQLYAVLALYNDTSYAAVAQTQMVGADGQVDRSAIRYVQQSLGVQAVPIAAQAYHDPRLTNSAAKEPFARLALAFAGADPQANQFYAETINDPTLTPDHRSNLIEDLNEDGFTDFRNLTANDLPLIENRIALIEQLAPDAMDDVNAAAFKEAYKDLLNMRTKVINLEPGQP